MSAPIGPGDFVECINVGPIDGIAAPALNLGAIYKIVFIEEWGSPLGPGVVLEGFPPIMKREDGAEYAGFLLSRFRPIYRPKHTWEDQFKHVQPEDVKQPVVEKV